MKRLCRILCVWTVLSLVCTCALAQGAQLYTLRIANPAVEYAGISLFDFEGAEVELDLYDNGEGGQTLLASLLANDTVAAKLTSVFDDQALFFTLEGLSRVYRLPLEALDAGEVGLSSESIEQVLQALLHAVEEYVLALESEKVDLGDAIVDHTQAGQISMHGYAFTLRAEDIQQALSQLFDDLNAIPGLEGMSFEVDLEEQGDASSDGEYTLEVWSSEDGAAVRIVILDNAGKKICTDALCEEDGAICVMTVGEENGVEMVRASIEGIRRLDGEMLMDLRMHASALEGGQWQTMLDGAIYAYPQGYTPDNADRSLFGLELCFYDGGEVVSDLRLENYFSPADGVNYDYDESYTQFFLGDSRNEYSGDLLIQNKHADGEEFYGAQLNLNAGDNVLSPYFTFAGTYAPNDLGGEDHAGVLTLGLSMNGLDNVMTLDVELSSAEVDPAEIPTLDTDAAVDIYPMNPEVSSMLESELNLVFMRVMGVMASLPDVARLLISAGTL